MNSSPLANNSRTGLAFSSTEAANAAFVPVGIVTVLLGPMLPTLSARWSLNYEQAGSLFTAQYVASTLAVALSGAIVSRCGFRLAINIGLFAMAAGVASLSLSSHALGLAGIACYGAGLGLAIPAANLLVAAMNGDRRSAALNRLNFWWSVGAVACPFLVAAAVKMHQTKLFLLLLAVFSLLAVLGIALLPAFVEPGAQAREQTVEPAHKWNRQLVAVFAALFFLYVGTENAFGGWIAAYARNLGSVPPAFAAAVPSFFYAALMAGRWIASTALHKVDEISTVRAGLAIALLGMVGLIFSRSITPVVISASVAGFGLAAVYPITISRMSHDFGTGAARIGAVMFTLTNLGGASVPWIVGYSSRKFNDLGVGMVVPVVATAGMFLLYYVYQRNVRQRGWRTAL